MDFNLRQHTIILAISGSRAYGTHTDTSDVDVKGVAIPPKKYYLGCGNNFEQADAPEHIAAFADLLNQEETAASTKEKLEGSVYELTKFMALATDANPNILDLLFCRDEEVRLVTPVGQKLRDNRELFISAKCKHTFQGYAIAQLKRIETHRKWLRNPPKAPPERSDYNLFPGIDKKQVNAGLSMAQKVIDGWELDLSRLEKSERQPIMDGVENFMAELSVTADTKWQAAARSLGYSDNLMEVLDRERRFRSDTNNWKQYKAWQEGRNPVRAKMEEEHGFDLKHASHLVRLLNTGIEILTTGKINTWRGDIDRDELLSIRNGAWTYEQVMTRATKQSELLNEIYSTKKYHVPHSPDRVAINNLCVELAEEFLFSGAKGLQAGG